MSNFTSIIGCKHGQRHVGETVSHELSSMKWRYVFQLQTRNSIRGFVHPSIVHWSIRQFVCDDQVEKWKNERFGYCLCMFMHGGGWVFECGWV